ncbi:hypothetical protein D3C86_1878660 [compost metagenome]
MSSAPPSTRKSSRKAAINRTVTRRFRACWAKRSIYFSLRSTEGVWRAASSISKNSARLKPSWRANMLVGKTSWEVLKRVTRSL